MPSPPHHADVRLPAPRSAEAKPDTTDTEMQTAEHAERADENVALRSPRSLRLNVDVYTDRLAALYRDSAQCGIGRRDFMRGAAALGVGGLCASPWLDACAANPGAAAQAGAARAAAPPLDLAEWSYQPQLAVQGVGRHFAASASFLESVLVRNGCWRYLGSFTMVVTVNH